VFLPRQFWALDQWGRAGRYWNYTQDTEWDDVEAYFVAVANIAAAAAPTLREATASSSELVRWARLLRVEEAQQASDIRRYDLHDAPFTLVSGSVEALGGLVDTYRLEVPGLIEGGAVHVDSP
jgi:hypothetical protein